MKPMRTIVVLVALGFVGHSGVKAQAQANHLHRTPEEQRNLDKVTDFFTNVLHPMKIERFKEYVAPTFVEHNPHLDGKLDALVELFSHIREKKPEGLGPFKVVVRLVEGDLVCLIVERGIISDPDNPTHQYMQLGLEVVRMKDGKQVEHWDEKMKLSDAAALELHPRPDDNLVATAKRQ
jgi:predicted SnoaL-like aldol condensation-catalyzing enzyme